MSTFTMRLCDVMSYGYDIGLQPVDYPIYDEAHRPDLNKRILDHYWFYEIGAETVEQFRFFLNRKMREIMPYYNQLYLSTRLQFDPLKQIDYSTISHSTVGSTTRNTEHGSATQSSDTVANARTVQSDFPQTQLAGNKDYASSAADSSSKTDVAGTSTSDGSSTAAMDGSNEATTSTSGRQASAAALILQYRETLLNVDMAVVGELAPCFMTIWDNGDSFSDGWNSVYGVLGFMGGFGPW